MKWIPAVALLALGACSPGGSEGSGAPDRSVATLDWARIDRVQAPRSPDLVAKLRELAAQLEASPADPSLHVRLGRTLFLLDCPAEALWHLERATELAPDDHEAHYQTGVLHLRENRARRAVESFEAATALQPNYAPAHRDLGFAYDALGDSERARAALEEALRSDPTDPEASYRLALLLEEEDSERAMALLRGCITLDPHHRGAHLNLAALCRRAGRTEEAEALLRRHGELAVLDDLGLDARSLDVGRFLAEGRYYAANDRLDRALEVCREAAQLYPEHPEVAFLSGIVHGLREEPGDAVAAYGRAIELRPADVRYYTSLAEVVARTGVTSPAARAHLERAAQRWPELELFAEALQAHGAQDS